MQNANFGLSFRVPEVIQRSLRLMRLAFVFRKVQLKLLGLRFGVAAAALKCRMLGHQEPDALAKHRRTAALGDEFFQQFQWVHGVPRFKPGAKTLGRSQLTALFKDGEMRSVLHACPERGRIGVAFNLANGEVMRVALKVHDAQWLADALQTCVHAEAGRRQACAQQTPAAREHEVQP